MWCGADGGGEGGRGLGKACCSRRLSSSPSAMSSGTPVGTGAGVGGLIHSSPKLGWAPGTSNPPHQSFRAELQTRAKTKSECSTSQTSQRERVHISTTQTAVPLLTINVDRLQLPILLHFHPLPSVLNNPADRQTNRWTVKGHAARASQQEVAGSESCCGSKVG